MSFSFLIDKPIDGPQYQTYTHPVFAVGGEMAWFEQVNVYDWQRDDP